MVDDEDAGVARPDEPDEPGAPPVVPGFELGELLARGGTSEVWAGVAVDGGQRVAVKVVRASPESVEAAAREAAVSARAASAHVVPVEACVGLPDGRAALVMPHLRGGSLHALVRARGHLSPGEVVTVLAPVASALGRLHDLGVVHGDVSPGNVLLDLEGRPLLGDLGLGHVVGEVSPGVWGTDGYVAPEVVLGADPSPASDVYSLGALGWLCLSGAVPGAPGLRPALAEVCRAGSGSEPVVRALDAALSPDPGERPAAHELAWLLFEAAEAEPLHLVRGDDEVSAVTYRLRAAAGRAPERTPPHPAARWVAHWVGRCVGRLGRLVGRSTVVGGREARRVRVAASPVPPRVPAPAQGGVAAGRGVPRRRGRHAALPGPRASSRVRVSAALVTAIGALVVCGLLVVAVAATGRDRGQAEGRSAAGSGSSLAQRSPVAERSPSQGDGRTGAPTDPRTDPAAPLQRPDELLGVLADARAAAWREATPALLRAADAPGSAAATRDAAAVAELARAGLRYSRLRYTVASADTISATHRDAVLRARIDTGPYAVVGPSGSTPRPAAAGEEVLVDLVRTEAGWRVRDIRPTSEPSG